MIQYLPIDMITMISISLIPKELINIININKYLYNSYIQLLIPYLLKNEQKISTIEFKFFLQYYLKKKINIPYEVRYTTFFRGHPLKEFTNIQLFKDGKNCKKKELTQAMRREMTVLPLRRVRKFTTDIEIETLMIGMYGVEITKPVVHEEQPKVIKLPPSTKEDLVIGTCQRLEDVEKQKNQKKERKCVIQ